jgi:hypothetical protein
MPVPPITAVVAETALAHVPVMFEGLATCNPLGRLSVKPTLFNPGVPTGLIIVKVNVVA